MNYILTVIEDDCFWVEIIVYLEKEQVYNYLQTFVDNLFGTVSFTYKIIEEKK
jgi:hypothetical protein